MAESAPRRATYADLAALPENVIGEIVDGELIASPRPALRHARASSRLGGVLGPPFDVGDGGPGGWIILDEPELHLSGDALVPDLAGWRRERVPEMPDVDAFTLAPDWVCEVLSPSTGVLDRARKLPIYARERVGHVWLVDPRLQTLEVFRREGSDWLLLGTFAGERRVRAEPFDAIDLDLSLLWAR